jgi:hypothetical protein
MGQSIPKIDTICKQCGKPFKTHPYRIKNGVDICCSNKCFYENRKSKRPTRICKHCGKPFKTKQSYINYGQTPKYCSRACSAEGQKIQIETKCPQCNKTFYERPSKLNEVINKFCSIPCMKAWQSINMSLEKNHEWRGGISFIPYCPLFDMLRKLAVRVFFGYTCIICGKHESENITKRGQEALSIHHVDHDPEQGCNGKPFNLVPMCRACHAGELHHAEEYRTYINKTLNEGFKWGIWSREQYELEVMYSE